MRITRGQLWAGLTVVAAMGLVGTSMVVNAQAAVPTGFSDTVVAKITLPVGIDATPDGRLMVTTKPGKFYVVKGSTTTLALDISAATCAKAPGGDERGMLSVAVDPNFASNNFIYIYYSANKSGGCFNRVSRFTMSGNTVASGSEKVLIDNIKGDGFHNAGDIVFGGDGNLLISVGDGHCLEGCDPSNNAAQDLKNLNGKVLRITPTGGIPSGNPFSGTGTARCATGAISSGKCQEIYAYGFRNPFRLAVDPNSTSRIFVNDVGQNTIEEVDQLKAGANYGWPKCEGKCGTSGLTNPVFQYSDTSGGTRAAITGGAFVPDNQWNPAYNGQYLYSDYVKNNIYQISNTGGSNKTFESGATAIAMKFAPVNPAQPSGQMALYYTNLGKGEVHKVTSGTKVPTASFTTNAATGLVSNCSTRATTAGDPPLAVKFDGSASADPNGRPLTYHWNFGDGGTATTTTATTSHTYTTKGNFKPTLSVTNDQGGTSNTASGQVRTDFGKPTPTITSPTASSTFKVGTTYTPKGTATDGSGAALASSALTWQVWLFHINHVHPVLDPVAGNGATAFVAPPAEQFSAIKGGSRLLVCLSATDSHGITTTIEQDFNPHQIPLTFHTSPAGGKVHIAEDDVDSGGNVADGATVTSWDGYQINVSANDQSIGGQNMTFSSWSDGGAKSHAITTPSAATTYTATFKPGGSTSTTLQAEDATLSNATVATNHTGFTGTGFVDYANQAGGYVQFTVSRSAAGSATLTFRFSNASGATRPASVMVNGTTVTTINFAATADWNTWTTASATVTLKSGSNTIRLTGTGATGGPNLDSLTIA
jgi:glucose/arabinose dehydrogenase